MHWNKLMVRALCVCCMFLFVVSAFSLLWLIMVGGESKQITGLVLVAIANFFAVSALAPWL